MKIIVVVIIIINMIFPLLKMNGIRLIKLLCIDKLKRKLIYLS